MSLTVEDIVTRCRGALIEHTPTLAVRDVLQELITRPAALEGALGTVEAGGITTVHRSDDLTILRVAWTPGMSLNPHEHRMWAAIGMFGGQEDNAFFRRSDGGLEASGGRAVRAGEVLLMGDDAIHSVTNSRHEYAVALHVYGGDFFAGERSEWTFDTHEERPRDLDATRRLFDEANERFSRESGRAPS
jgi:predicted metal-dependent enzyme (double-stranded beta helix superfamily)